MALEVHDDPVRAQQPIVRPVLVAAAQDGVHAGEQLAIGVGLGDVVVRTDLQADDLVDLGVLGGEHDDGDPGGAPNAATHLGSRQTREHEVEQHEVDRIGPVRPAGRLEALNGRDAVLGLHDLEAVSAQTEGERIAIVLLVLDEQNAGHV